MQRYSCGGRAMREDFLPAATIGDESIVRQPAWVVLKEAVEAIRVWQSKDGSIDFTTQGAPARSEVEGQLERAIEAVRELAPLLPHDATYHGALVADLRRWSRDGFG